MVKNTFAASSQVDSGLQLYPKIEIKIRMKLVFEGLIMFVRISHQRILYKLSSVHIRNYGDNRVEFVIVWGI